MAGPVGAVQRPVVAGEDLRGGLAGEVAHLVQGRFERAAVGDPFAVEDGVLGGENLGGGLAGPFPRELPVGAVPLLGVGSAAVWVVAGGVSLDQRSLAGEPDLGQAGCERLVVGA